MSGCSGVHAQPQTWAWNFTPSGELMALFQAARAWSRAAWALYHASWALYHASRALFHAAPALFHAASALSRAASALFQAARALTSRGGKDTFTTFNRLSRRARSCSGLWVRM